MRNLEEIISDRQKNSMEGHFSRLTAEQVTPTPRDYLSLVAEYQKENPGVSKAQAMRAVTAKHPEEHRRWIEKVNSVR